jgi:two-component system response regulator NreC
VLLADNHGAILNTCARLLRDDFDLVAVVPDGRQALESALRLNPDVAILDISMPELDGFQTLRELRRAGSRARVVFLTMH